MPGSGTADAVFTVRRMRERCGCKGGKLYFAFGIWKGYLVECLEGSLDGF